MVPDGGARQRHFLRRLPLQLWGMWMHRRDAEVEPERFSYPRSGRDTSAMRTCSHLSPQPKRQPPQARGRGMKRDEHSGSPGFPPCAAAFAGMTLLQVPDLL